MQGISIFIASSMDMLGVSLSTASSIDVQVVSLSTVSSMDMQGVSSSHHHQYRCTQGVSPSTASKMDVPGVSNLNASSMNVQGVPSSPSVWTYRVYPLPPPAGWTCRLYSSTAFSMEVQGVSLSTASSMDNRHAECIHHLHCGRAGCTYPFSPCKGFFNARMSDCLASQPDTGINKNADAGTSPVPE